MNFTMSTTSKRDLFDTIILYAFVFFCGFANLATEIIAPRLFSSLFGSTTIIWAIIISVTLIGISIGYYAGGRIPYERIHVIIPIRPDLGKHHQVSASFFAMHVNDVHHP